MRRIHRLAALAALLTLLVACGKPPVSNDAPLAFAPADTAYAYANLEPLPAAVTEQLTRPMREYWPSMVAIYESVLRDPHAHLDDRTRHIVLALLDELKTHASWDRLRAIGFKPDARMALYGVGIVPVLRIELGDPAAFRSEVARVEQAAGTKLRVARTGGQEYWEVGSDVIAAAIAIEGKHLVVTAFPPGAGDKLKQTLLGVKRPAQNLAATGTLDALAKQKGFSPYGEGYVDFVRLAERLSRPLEGSDAEFARALGLPGVSIDAACRSEYLDIAHRFPRLTIGAEELTPRRLRIRAELEIEPGLAAQIAAAVGVAPGSADANPGPVDFAVAAPILRLKDFWLARTANVAAKPFRCASLASLNDSFAKSAANVDVTIPPPLSDLTGARVSIDSFEPGPGRGGPPQITGRVLIATSNPQAALAMAQLSLPPLQKMQVAPDGKPVAVPADALPPTVPPLHLAMTEKAIAVAIGANEAAALGAYLDAPAAAAPVFMRMRFSGAVYGWMAHAFEAMKSTLPADSRKRLEQQQQLFAIYRKWLRSSEFTLTAEPTGIVMRQTVEMNAAPAP